MEHLSLSTTSPASTGRFAGTVIFTSEPLPPPPPFSSPALAPVSGPTTGFPPVAAFPAPEGVAGEGAGGGRSGTENVRRLCCIRSAAFFLDSTLILGSSGTCRQNMGTMTTIMRRNASVRGREKRRGGRRVGGGEQELRANYVRRKRRRTCTVCTKGSKRAAVSSIEVGANRTSESLEPRLQQPCTYARSTSKKLARAPEQRPAVDVTYVFLFCSCAARDSRALLPTFPPTMPSEVKDHASPHRTVLPWKNSVVRRFFTPACRAGEEVSSVQDAGARPRWRVASTHGGSSGRLTLMQQKTPLLTRTDAAVTYTLGWSTSQTRLRKTPSKIGQGERRGT